MEKLIMKGIQHWKRCPERLQTQIFKTQQGSQKPEAAMEQVLLRAGLTWITTRDSC